MLLRALIVSLLVHVALLLSWEIKGAGNHVQGMRAASLEARLERRASTPDPREGVVPGKLETQSKATLPSQKSLSPSISDDKKPYRERLASGALPAKLSLVKSVADNSQQHPKSEHAPPSPVSQSIHLESISEEVLRQYRLALAREARRFKRYPALAREQGWEGGVTIILRFLPERDPDVRVGKSSGYEQLDENAQQTIEKASRLVALPSAFVGRAISMELSMRYELDD